MKILKKLSIHSLAITATFALASIALAEDVPTGPIFSNASAKTICPAVCGGLRWNGQWVTTVPGSMSVCGTTTGNNFAVGPIFSNADAKMKCPRQLARVRWSGQWRTTVPNQTSVCGCNNPPAR